MKLVWVIGSGGLLGSALKKALLSDDALLFIPPFNFNWGDDEAITEQLRLIVDVFSLSASNLKWEIYWSAGVGSMNSSDCDFIFEDKFLENLIFYLLGNDNLNLMNGTFIFTSSAGAVYAGINGKVINETTEVSPVNPYGRHKLLQEAIVSKLSKDGFGARIIICRVTNLYGINQSSKKNKGLLTQIARCILTKKAIHIYVPLDTMRDYIEVNSAAQLMVASTKNLRSRIQTIIIASEVSISIAQILTIYKKISKQNLQYIISNNTVTKYYVRYSRFKSLYRPQSINFSHSDIVVGAMKILNNELILFSRRD